MTNQTPAPLTAAQIAQSLLDYHAFLIIDKGQTRDEADATVSRITEKMEDDEFAAEVRVEFDALIAERAANTQVLDVPADWRG